MDVKKAETEKEENIWRGKVFGLCRRRKAEDLKKYKYTNEYNIK